MPNGTDVIYSYDGSFDGLMCCMFESCTRREFPSDIISGEPEQLSFGSIRYIKTDPSAAERVIRSIPQKMGVGAFDFIRKAFLTCIPDRDMLILKFMYKGYRYGGRVMDMLSDDVVHPLERAVHHCTNEAHLLKGFIRFTDTGEALAAVITPKNKVIPLLAQHFTDRFRNENFLIYDKTHRMALIYLQGKAEILESVDLTLPEVTEEEEHYRSLWKTFYDAVGIKERYNPRCRMTHMPKRYWENITEMEE